MCTSSNLSFLLLCTCPWIVTKASQVLILRLQIHFAKDANSQIWNPQAMRINCIYLMNVLICNPSPIGAASPLHCGNALLTLLSLWHSALAIVPATMPPAFFSSTLEPTCWLQDWIRKRKEKDTTSLWKFKKNLSKSVRYSEVENKTFMYVSLSLRNKVIQVQLRPHFPCILPQFHSLSFKGGYYLHLFVVIPIHVFIS